MKKNSVQELLRLTDLRGHDSDGRCRELPEGDCCGSRFRERDYALALKGNRQLFYKEVKAYFEKGVLEKLKGKEGCYKKTAEPEHRGSAVAKESEKVKLPSCQMQ